MNKNFAFEIRSNPESDTEWDPDPDPKFPEKSDSDPKKTISDPKHCFLLCDAKLFWGNVMLMNLLEVQQKFTCTFHTLKVQTPS